MQRLIVTEQPQSQFYKDEGGKSNFLQASIQLISQDGQPVAASGLQIKCELYLENGTYIEDQSILKMAAKSPVRLNQYGASTFAFRVEMVSRRVDQQKFVLKLSPAQPQMIDSVMTEGVFVMSKRKNRPISSLTTIGLKRARLESQAEEWKQMETFIREQHTATNRLILDRLNLLIESVHNLDARVDRIERRLDQGVNVGTNSIPSNLHSTPSNQQPFKNTAMKTETILDDDDPMPDHLLAASGLLKFQRQNSLTDPLPLMNPHLRASDSTDGITGLPGKNPSMFRDHSLFGGRLLDSDSD